MIVLLETLPTVLITVGAGVLGLLIGAAIIFFVPVRGSLAPRVSPFISAAFYAAYKAASGSRLCPNPPWALASFLRDFLCQLRGILSRIQQRERLLPSTISCLVLGAIPPSYFFTPVYSSTVFVLMVVVTFDVSDTCVYVAVVEIVLHALQELIPAQTATLISTADTNTSFFIVLFIFG